MVMNNLFGSKSKLICIKLRIGSLIANKQLYVGKHKRDVAGLLASGLPDEAFERIESLNIYINNVKCYENIEQSCDIIDNNLQTLQKQIECPAAEVAEAMSNLIYAADRLQDFPELSNLKYLFLERYGRGIESCVNSEFMKKTETRQLSKQEKLQMMQQVADEFSVQWNQNELDMKLLRAANECKENNEDVIIELPTDTNGDSPKGPAEDNVIILLSRKSLMRQISQVITESKLVTQMNKKLDWIATNQAPINNPYTENAKNFISVGTAASGILSAVMLLKSEVVSESYAGLFALITAVGSSLVAIFVCLDALAKNKDAKKKKAMTEAMLLEYDHGGDNLL